MKQEILFQPTAENKLLNFELKTLQTEIINHQLNNGIFSTAFKLKCF
jgi:hypothetical protein